MKWSFFLSFYKMTHDPLSRHSKKKAAVEPGVKGSTVGYDRNLTAFLRRQVNGYFVVHSIENGCFGTLICPWNKAGICISQPYRSPKTQNYPSGSKHGGVSGHYMKQIIHQS